MLSLALGIAFRARGPDPVVVGALPGVGAEVHRSLVAADATIAGIDP